MPEPKPAGSPCTKTAVGIPAPGCTSEGEVGDWGAAHAVIGCRACKLVAVSRDVPFCARDASTLRKAIESLGSSRPCHQARGEGAWRNTPRGTACGFDLDLGDRTPPVHPATPPPLLGLPASPPAQPSPTHPCPPSRRKFRPCRNIRPSWFPFFPPVISEARHSGPLIITLSPTLAVVTSPLLPLPPSSFPRTSHASYVQLATRHSTRLVTSGSPSPVDFFYFRSDIPRRQQQSRPEPLTPPGPPAKTPTTHHATTCH